MATTAAQRYAGLVSWVESAGGQLHPSVEIYNDEYTEGSLRVKPKCTISPGDSIVKLPLVRSLSFLNAICGHPDFPATASLGVAAPSSSPEHADPVYFPPEFLKSTPPHVTGRFFLIQQHLLGPVSQWAPYISTLPQPGDPNGLLPCAWPAADLEFLRGTNAWIAVQEIKATLDSEYEAAISLLSSFPAKKTYTKDLYVWAYCIFASRSFRQSLTIPAATALSLVPKADDFSVLLPLFDMGNHHPQAKTMWKTPAAEQETAADAQGKFCELQVGQPYRAGEQVFNNYGNKTNAELLLGYGFILAESEDFHNDYVHVKTRPSRLQTQQQQSRSQSAQSQAEDGGRSTAHNLAQTHLVSLRPIADESSLAGRARLLNPEPKAILSCYTHVQDTLVASLYEIICQARGLPLSASGAGSVTIDDILAGNAPGGEEDLTDEIINALGTKLSIDLETLEQAEAMVGKDESVVKNGNQQLAALYRGQCKRVLENALGSLGGDDGEAEEMEEEDEE